MTIEKDNLLRYEKDLSPYATKSQEAIRFREEAEDMRPSFSHDADRIIYSLSFTRYMKKTQVFSFQENDHVSKRITHVLFVSKIARTIARALCLNEDLVEAIALGHDIGHTPLGHVGEHILDEISRKELNENFYHNVQSVRNFLSVENHGRGLNLTLQVLDGIMCHNGEILSPIYEPVSKTKEQFLKEYEACYKDSNVAKTIRPMTLEGCVVRICDMIAYIGRDVEDALLLGVLSKDEIPEEIAKVLGTSNREIVNSLVLDIVNQSYGKPYIKLSKEVFEALKAFKKFNYQHIYNKANSIEAIEEYRRGLNLLYRCYLKDLEEKNEKSVIYQLFLNDMNKEYRENTKKQRIVLDFLSGMTDDFFLQQVRRESKRDLGK